MKACVCRNSGLTFCNRSAPVFVPPGKNLVRINSKIGAHQLFNSCAPIFQDISSFSYDATPSVEAQHSTVAPPCRKGFQKISGGLWNDTYRPKKYLFEDLAKDEQRIWEGKELLPEKKDDFHI